MKPFTDWMKDQAAPKPAIGIEEGAVCNRDGCDGKMYFDEVQNCSCHISPPCSACVDNPLICDTCIANPEDDV